MRRLTVLVIVSFLAAALPLPCRAQNGYGAPGSTSNGYGGKSHWLEKPGATSDLGALSSQVDGYLAKAAQAKRQGNLAGAAQSNAAAQNLLRQLTSMEPQNAKWKVLKATAYVNQAGGPSRSGTAGDRFSLQQALRELDMAAACPNASQYASQISSLRASIAPELKKRIARGKEIQRAGAMQLRQLQTIPDGPYMNGGGSSYCTVCGHIHRGGECSYRRD